MSDSINNSLHQLVHKRSMLVANVENILENISSRREAKKNNGDDLFDFGADSTADSKTLNLVQDNNPKSILEILMMEKEILGLYVSGNPLSQYLHIQNWVRDILVEPNLHIILVEKIRKVFTRANKMMLAMDVTSPTENLEAVVFPKLAPELSPILTEKTIFWMRGTIKEPQQKEKGEEVEGEIKEFVESKKIMIEAVGLFENGVLGVLAPTNISPSVHQTLSQVDWNQLLYNPTTIVAKAQAVIEEVDLKMSKSFSVAKIQEIKSKLSREPFENCVKVNLWLEHLDQWKKISGQFWLDKDYYQQLVKD